MQILISISENILENHTKKSPKRRELKIKIIQFQRLLCCFWLKGKCFILSKIKFIRLYHKISQTLLLTKPLKLFEGFQKYINLVCYIFSI